MIVKPQGDKLLSAFHDSVMKLTDDIIKKVAWIEENDTDPENTKNHAVDKMLKEWFMRSGGMGY